MKNTKNKKMKKDKCQKCGHCCRNLIIEIGEHDVLRESKLLEYAEPFNGDGERELDREYLLTTPCPFLADNKCSIYPKRPNVCVGFKFGSSQCKYGRSEEVSLCD